MAFVKNWLPSVGEKVKTTRRISAGGGYFEKGSVVTITAIGDRGYDVEDEDGNRIIECGWEGFARIK